MEKEKICDLPKAEERSEASTGARQPFVKCRPMRRVRGEKYRWVFEKGQIFVPNFGYNGPLRTRGECQNPAFADHKLHRVGRFATMYLLDALPGYVIVKKCVNCGREFDTVFAPHGKSWPKEYQVMYYTELKQVGSAPAA